MRPYRKDPAAAWRLRRVSDSECSHWASAISRHNQSTVAWSVRVLSVLLGECDPVCAHAVRSAARLGQPKPPAAGSRPSIATLAATIAARLTKMRKLDESARGGLCASEAGGAQTPPHHSRLTTCGCQVELRRQ